MERQQPAGLVGSIGLLLLESGNELPALQGPSRMPDTCQSLRHLDVQLRLSGVQALQADHSEVESTPGELVLPRQWLQNWYTLDLLRESGH
jgi:hypothetical protein